MCGQRYSEVYPIWVAGIFEDWRRARFPKVATLEPGVLFKRYELHKLQALKVP